MTNRKLVIHRKESGKSFTTTACPPSSILYCRRGKMIFVFNYSTLYFLFIHLEGVSVHARPTLCVGPPPPMCILFIAIIIYIYLYLFIYILFIASTNMNLPLYKMDSWQNAWIEKILKFECTFRIPAGEELG